MALQKNYTYDSLNRVKTYTDNNGGVITVAYDAAGNIVQAKDQNNNITIYTYDNLNRINTVTYPDGRFTQLGFDRKGNLVSRRLTDGSTITYQYDSINRVTSKTLPGGEIYNYTYDLLGRIIIASNSNGPVLFTYDALNRLTSETFDGRTTRYSYNTANRTVTTIYPDSTVITKTFDLRGRLISIAKNSSIIASYQYNNSDQLTVKNFGNGISTNLQYDFANRLSNISTAGGAIQNTVFAYDKERNKTEINRQNSPLLSEQFIYDNGKRLTGYKRGIIGGSPTLQNTYTYDAVGNRTNANLNGTNTNYSINNLNQVTGSNNGSLNINFQYDNNGNLLYDGIYYKTYSADGKLLKDSASVSNVITYQYDALGRRIQKMINGLPVKYTYSGLAQIEERDGISNDLLGRTIFAHFLSPVMREKNNSRYYYHQNELNSVEAITNSAGQLTERYQYDAYGKPTMYDGSNNLIASSIAGNRFGFTGQEYDSASGSYHFHFREYSVSTGSFFQRDPIGYTDAMGMYQYVNNNPANGIDILGLEDFTKCNGTTYTTGTTTVENKPTPDPPTWTLYVIISQWSNALSTASNAQALSLLQNGGKSFLLNGAKFGLAAGPLGVVATVTSAIDFGSNYNTNSTGANWDQGTNVYLNATLATGGLLAAAGSATVSAPAVVAGLVGIGVYGIADGITSSVTGKGINENLYPISDYLGDKFYGNEMATASYNANLGYQMMYGDADKWLKIRKWLDERDEFNKREREKKIKDPTYTIIPYLIPHPYRVPNCPQNTDPGGNQNNKPKGPGTPGSTTVDQSWDPNEIVGPEGVPSRHWVSVHDRLPYTILYENDKSASAPAKYVKITSPIEPKQDPNTFQLGSFGFNTQTFSVPPNTASYYQRLNCIDSLGLFVDITAGYDQINNQAFWEFQAIDPLTLLPPSAPSVGFLQLQDSTKPLYGHAFVNFSIRPIQSAVTLDTIGARAEIKFDLNAIIPTNIHKNTIDAFPPVSHITSTGSLVFVDTTTVKISWSGQDDLNGVGVAKYSLYVSVNGAPYTLYQSEIKDTSINFKAIRDTTYCFFTVAFDSVGNIEPLKNSCELSVKINSTGPLPVTWLYFNGSKKDRHALLKWATGMELNTKHFVIERSFNGNSFVPVGTVAAIGNSSTTHEYSFIDSFALELPTGILYYRLRQVDKDGKLSYSIVVTLRLDKDDTQPMITAYPNPFSESITLKVVPGNPADKTTGVELFTIQGRLLYSRKMDRSGTSTTLLNDLPFLPAGVYVLKAVVNDKQYTFKITKQ